MTTQIKVRLTVDLTAYHPRLVSGVEGYTIGQYGEWSRYFDRFVGVCFPGIHTLDVLWESLEIIDKEYLERVAKEKLEKMELLKGAHNVVKYVGPRGGFRSLHFEYTDKEGRQISESTGFKNKAEKLESIFSENGIPIKVEVK